jgi:translation initiation factor IF-2
MRVWELAQRVGIPTHKFVRELSELGVKVTSAMSVLEDKEAEDILQLFISDKEKCKLKIKKSTTIRELAEILKLKPANIIKTLLKEGLPVNINQRLDSSLIEKINKIYNLDLQLISYEEELISSLITRDMSQLVPCAPVITVMGHIDHGKTTLLDAIRHTDTASSEIGGITQHIGAYKISYNGKDLVFLDTPGHEAFTSLRLRGAQVTNIVILVVAADDGVMPQTKEALSHARAANVPVLVAINKIDLPTAKVEETKKQLADLQLIPEEWGGDTIMVEISAKNKQGIDNLLEMLILLAETLELKTNINTYAQGTVLESRITREYGPVATILLDWGRLRVGDTFVCGEVVGKVRAQHDWNRKSINEAIAVTPVEVVGFSKRVKAGDKFYVIPPSKIEKALELALLLKKDEEKKPVASFDSFYEKLKRGKEEELRLILKADTQGSQEAILELLSKLSSPKVKINVIYSGVGNVTSSDVLLAAASSAIIIAFYTKIEPSAKITAQKEKIEIRSYDIIYKLEEEIKELLEGLLPPLRELVPIGVAEIRKLFNIPKVGLIAGSYVKEGKVVVNSKARIWRDNREIYNTKIISLRRFKEVVKEVVAGYECGIGMEGVKDLKEGDRIEVLEERLVKEKL